MVNFKGSIFDHGSMSKAGHSPSNPMKPNQDSVIARPNLIVNQLETLSETDIEQYHLFGV